MVLPNQESYSIPKLRNLMIKRGRVEGKRFLKFFVLLLTAYCLQTTNNKGGILCIKHLETS